MGRSLGLQLAAYALVGIFLGAGFVGAQQKDTIPGLPLQGTFDCPSALDRPVSMTDTPGLTGPGVLRPDDIDKDGASNHVELLDGSDPTWTASTPSDHDGDGVPLAADPCDYNPAIPGFTVSLEVTCTNCGSAPIKRLDVLHYKVHVTNGAGQPANAAGDKVTVSIDFGKNGTVDQTFDITGETGHVVGEYTTGPNPDPEHNPVSNPDRPILINDPTKTWSIKATATIGLITRDSAPVDLTIAPTTFALTVSLGHAPIYFEDEVIHIRATPQTGHFFDAQHGKATFTIEKGGVPLSSDPVNGDPMTWDNTAWAADFSTDRISDHDPVLGGDNAGTVDGVEAALLDGEWTINVKAADAAPAEPNTGSGTKAVTTLSQAVDDLTLTAEGAVERTDTIHYRLQYENRGTPAALGAGESINIDAKIGTVVVIDNASMTAGALTGDYTLNFKVPIGTPQGSLVATATVHHGHGHSNSSNEAKTTVNPTAVALAVTTDKASYTGAGVEGPTANGATTAIGAAVGIVTGPSPTPSDAVAALQGGATPKVTAGETVVVIAFPTGVLGTDYFNDTVDGQPGHATVDLQFMGTASNLAADADVIQNGRAMTWVKNGDGLTTPHFRYAYVLQPTDPSGAWTAKVSYTDDAPVKPNNGTGTAHFQVNSALSAPLPPSLSIDSINGIPAAAGRAQLIDEAWTVSGRYLERSTPAAPTDVNEVWVRIQGATVTKWVPAILSANAAPRTGSWTVVLHSQEFYKIQADGDFTIQAVAIVNPARAAGLCVPGTGAQGTVNAAACVAFTPDGTLGAQVLGLSPSAPIAPAVYSKTESAPVHLDFPNTPKAELLGVVGPDGSLKGMGDVLWDGARHLIRGVVSLNGTTPGAYKIRIARVANDGCRSTTVEWCLRDVVTRYTQSGGPDVDGFDLEHPPVALRVDQHTSPNGRYWFNWTWDIQDSKQGPAQDQCTGSHDGSALVEDTSSLVRRTNTRYDNIGGVVANGGPMMFAENGGSSTCHYTPEQIQDQAYLQPWEKSLIASPKDEFHGHPGEHAFITGARYWIWMDLTTSHGFHFNQTKPGTAQDVDAGLATSADAPPLSGANAATATGTIPGFEAKQLRFGAYPIGAITGVRSVTSQNDPVEAAPGGAAFRLRSSSGPITITGTVDNNGNSVNANTLRVVLYNVRFVNCLQDPAAEATNDFFDPDADGEWCLVRTETVPIPPSAFTGEYAGSASLTGAHAFSVVWNPSGPASGVWFIGVSIATADGDRIESVPPVVSAVPAGSFVNPVRTVNDPASFNYAAKFETFCASQPCNGAPATGDAADPAFLPGTGASSNGVFGFGYTGAMLAEAKATLNVVSLGPLKPTRFAAPNGAYGADCNYSNVPGEPLCPTGTLRGRSFVGAVTGDSLSLVGDASDFATLNDLTQVKVDFKVVGYELLATGLENLNTDVTVQTIPTQTFQLGADSAMVTRVLATLPGTTHQYLDHVTLNLPIDTSSYLETLGPNVAYTKMLTRALGNERSYVRGEMTISLTSASGFVRKLPVLDLQVDRVTGPESTLVSASVTAIDPSTFASSTATKTASALGHVEGGAVVPNAYDLSGNSKIRFDTVYRPAGKTTGTIQLGGTGINLQKLTGIDVALSTTNQHPDLEFYTFTSNGDGVLDAQGVPQSKRVDLPFPVYICPGHPQDAVDGAESAGCDYTGAKPINSGGASRIDGATIFLIPLRVGVDPIFLRVDDPSDPTTWSPDAGDFTFGADLQVNGRIVDQHGHGPYVDTDQASNTGKGGGDNYTSVDFYNFGLSGDLDPKHLAAGLSSGDAGITYPNKEQTPQPVPREWAEAGVDEACGAWIMAVLAGSGSTDPGACYDTHTPISPKTMDPATFVAMCLGDTPPTSAAIANCFKSNDDWGQCFLQSPTFAEDTAQCPAGTAASDEHEHELWTLINRDLPIWIRVPGLPPAHPCTNPTGGNDVCQGGAWQAPEDPNAPSDARDDFQMPRGFIWSRTGQAGGPTVVVTGPDHVTYDLSMFEHVFANLSANSPDFGKLVVPDGKYIVTLRGSDNVESFSSVDDPSVPNDAARFQDFTFYLKNDKDGDGVSDIRETWLNARIHGNNLHLDPPMRKICAALPYEDCSSDRYQDQGSVFPDPTVKASTESDWDADGLPNLLSVSTPEIRNPIDGSLIQAAVPVSVDVEIVLNADPLVADLPGTPAQGACVGGDFGSGPMGDRNRDCIPNLIDLDKAIHRCTPADPDADGDGYCASEETRFGSSDNDAAQTPSDVDGDGIPNSVDSKLDTVTGALSTLADTVNGLSPAKLCVSSATVPCADGHLVTVTFADQPVGHVYVDADPAAKTFGVGFTYTGDKPAAGCGTQPAPRHCELVGTKTVKDAIETVTGLLDGGVCIAGAPAPLTGTCPDGHAIVVYTKGAQGIEHFYVDANTGTPSFSVGFHYSGAKPTFCLNEVRAGHCEVVGTKTLSDALGKATDADADGADNQAELNGKSNPFYKYSKPGAGNNGGGFPGDWDADGSSDATELGRGTPTNPFQKCSNPFDGTRGWSPTNPTVSCEDTNPVGGLNN